MKLYGMESLILCLAVCLPGGLFAQEDNHGAVKERVAQWEMAAQNREWAAVTRENEAGEQRKYAEEILRREYVHDSERMANCNRSGDLLRQAGDLEGAASVNYDMAVKNWQKVAEGWAQLNEPDKERKILDKAALAEEKALDTCARAADAYEQAAVAFNRQNADQPEKAAVASEKAAMWREKLAQRK